MLYRNIIDWEWYSDVNTSKVFFHCLLKVNYSAKRWQGILVQKGEFVTSYERLAVETGLTISKVRTALSKLQSTNDISIKTTTSYTKIGILNLKNFVAEHSSEQIDARVSIPNSKHLANGSQLNNNQLATTNTNNIKSKKRIFKERVFSHSNYNSKILQSFFNYWSELDNSKLEMRFEADRFFEVDKRLKKWASNERKSPYKASEENKLLTNR
ncbi:hypothetical protein [Lacinutrix venerupis]|uniref:hypothetical protein n=1 Tax=Lacinutrix venerupis TaxID=1486034 RepID=UPI0014745AB4|nr:hypothetical protein [Lacinutrix venerupis]